LFLLEVYKSLNIDSEEFRSILMKLPEGGQTTPYIKEFERLLDKV